MPEPGGEEIGLAAELDSLPTSTGPARKTNPTARPAAKGAPRKKKAREPAVIRHSPLLPLAVMGLAVGTLFLGIFWATWLILVAGVGLGFACMGLFVPELKETKRQVQDPDSDEYQEPRSNWSSEMGGGVGATITFLAIVRMVRILGDGAEGKGAMYTMSVVIFGLFAVGMMGKSAWENAGEYGAYRMMAFGYLLGVGVLNLLVLGGWFAPGPAETQLAGTEGSEVRGPNQPGKGTPKGIVPLPPGKGQPQKVVPVEPAQPPPKPLVAGETVDPAHVLGVHALAVSDNGQTAAFATQQGTVCVWQVEGRKMLAHFAISPGVRIDGIAVSGDGSRVAVKPWQGPLEIWDTAARKNVAKDLAMQDTSYVLAYSSDDSRLLGPGNRGLHVWNAGTGAAELEYLPGGQCLALGFSGDGRRVVSVIGGIVRIFDGPDKVSFLNGANPLQDVRSAALSQDGSRAVTVTSRATQVWALGQDKPIAERKTTGDPLSAARLLGDGQQVVELEGNQVLVWKVDSPEGAVPHALDAKPQKWALSRDGRRLVYTANPEKGLVEIKAWNAP